MKRPDPFAAAPAELARLNELAAKLTALGAPTTVTVSISLPPLRIERTARRQATQRRKRP